MLGRGSKAEQHKRLGLGSAYYFRGVRSRVGGGKAVGGVGGESGSAAGVATRDPVAPSRKK